MGRKVVPDSTKWQIVAYHKANYQPPQIAEMLKVSRKCVSNTINTWRKTKNVKNKSRAGRPRKTSPRDDSMLFRLARANPYWSIRKLSMVWCSDGSPVPRVGRSTISNRLLEFKLESHEVTVKPLLNAKDKEKRLKWCMERRNWSHEKWASVIFSDESNYQVINRKNKPTVRRFKEEKYEPRFIKGRVQAGGGSIGVWGCFNINGTGMCKTYGGRMNQDTYIGVLENCMIPSRDLLIRDTSEFLYQQDNAPCHKAKKVMKWFDENGVQLLPWPAKSPDLNPIEQLWNIIDQKLLNIEVSNLAQLEQAIKRLWKEITLDTCINLIESMPKRVELCIKARGGHFKY